MVYFDSDRMLNHYKVLNLRDSNCGDLNSKLVCLGVDYQTILIVQSNFSRGCVVSICVELNLAAWIRREVLTAWHIEKNIIIRSPAPPNKKPSVITYAFTLLLLFKVITNITYEK